MRQRIEDGKLVIEHGEKRKKSIELTPQVPNGAGTNGVLTDSQEEYAQLVNEQLKQEQEVFNEEFNNATEEGREAILEATASKWGCDKEAFVSAEREWERNPKLPISDVIETLGFLPIEEALNRVSLSFPLSDLIPFTMVRNGLRRHFYRDFFKADHMSAWKMDELTFDSSFKPKRVVPVEEIFKVDTPYHMATLLLSPMLNQNTRDMGLFSAILNDIENNVMKPMAVALYRERLRIITANINYDQFPLETAEGADNGMDWSTDITFAETFEGENDIDMMIKWMGWVAGLNQPSRNHYKGWTPNGLTQDLMNQLELSRYVWIVPTGFKAFWEMKLKATTFHDMYLNISPSILELDYQKAWGEFNGDTNIKSDKRDFVAFLVPKGDSAQFGIRLMYQFYANRSGRNANLTDWYHVYTYVGPDINRLTPILPVHLTSKETDNGGGSGGGVTQEYVDTQDQAMLTEAKTFSDSKWKLVNGLLTAQGTGDISANNKKITTLKEGTGASDVVTKQYVDTHSGATE